MRIITRAEDDSEAGKAMEVSLKAEMKIQNQKIRERFGDSETKPTPQQEPTEKR